MMLKVVPQGGWNFHDQAAQFIKFSSRGLIGLDRDRLVKRAGNELLDRMRDLEVLPGEPLVHLIALGATEKTGSNRNGDGFKEACCERYHPTFVKHARLYYDHKNTNPAESYGVVKLSYYNRPMGRVELIVGVNETKEAARRNGGLVDHRFLKAVDKGSEDVGVSMACKVAYDVCSSCFNKAATRRDYCGEDKCPHGGCRHNLTKVSEDGHVLHVDNPHPTWFDISHVGHPADRTAFVLGMAKRASAGAIGGAELAEHYGLKPDWNNSFGPVERLQLILHKLASREAELSTEPLGPLDAAYRWVNCPVSPKELAHKTGVNPGILKLSFVSLPLGGETAVLACSNPSRYFGTTTPDDRVVVKAAAVAAISSRPEAVKAASAVGANTHPLSCRALAEQLSWCAAGWSPEEVDRRVEMVTRINRIG